MVAQPACIPVSGKAPVPGEDHPLRTQSAMDKAAKKADTPYYGNKGRSILTLLFPGNSVHLSITCIVF